MKKQLTCAVALCACALLVDAQRCIAALDYYCSNPSLEVAFKVAGNHYSGAVTGGNLFLASDIDAPPAVVFKKAKAKKLYTLLMIDFDGNANGSYPDAVASGENSPVRHWIVGNIPGELLRTAGYTDPPADVPAPGKIQVLQAYRSPHIPVVSDRYGIYLFEQAKEIAFAKVPDPITKFDSEKFLSTYNLHLPVAANYFVAVHVSASPFSGQSFHGNDVSSIWHKDLGKGGLTPSR
jgi:hypothetical protein